MRVLAIVITGAALSGCANLQYTLVKPGPVPVANGAMTVSPTGDWSRAPATLEPIKYEENWTRDGFMLEQIQFAGAVTDGQALVKQRDKADQQAPVFHATMTPTDLTSMVESVYRVKGWAKVFTTNSVKPVSFVGHNGVQFDYEYVGEDNVRWRGRSVMAIADGKLYLMSLNGTALHYFGAALPEFDAMAGSAKVK